MEKNEKMITVIIPAYNAQDTVEACVKSIIDKNVEIIIVDDGSTDDTLKICQKLSKENENIKIISQENKGSFYARDIGIKSANGKYAMFLDVDDLYLENTISRVREIIEKYNEPDLIRFRYKKEPDGYEQYRYAEEEEKQIFKKDFKKDVYPLFLQGYMLNTVWSNCTKTEILKNVKIIGEGTGYGQDLVFNLELFSNINNLVFIEDVLYQYNYRANSSTNSKKLNKLFRNLRDSIEIYTLLYKYLLRWNMCDEENVEIVNQRVKKESNRYINIIKDELDLK